MPIAVFLEGQTTRVMGVAYEMVHAVLARDWGEAADQIIAKKVIELAKAGEANPDRICEQVLVYFRGKRL
jgi:hypothetical protein